MRRPHNGKPACALADRPRNDYTFPMQHRSPRRLLLRAAAAVLFAATIATWAGTGAHRGWTQTSVTEIRHDEITGIDYPVQREGFVAGVEVVALGALLAATLAGASFLGRSRRGEPAS